MTEPTRGARARSPERDPAELRLLAAEIATTRLPDPAAARLLRVGRGLSLRQAAALIGCHWTTLRRWELAITRPRGPQRVAYSRVLAELARLGP